MTQGHRPTTPFLVEDAHRRPHDDTVSGGAGSLAEVHVLHVEEMALVEAVEPLEDRTPDNHRRGRDPIQIAVLPREWRCEPRATVAVVTRRRHRPHEEACQGWFVSPRFTQRTAVGVDLQGRRHRDVQRDIDERGELARKQVRVRVQEREPLCSRRGSSPLVGRSREPPVLVVTQQRDAGVL